MTIAEIKQLQYDDKSMTKKEWIDSGKLHAVGRYHLLEILFLSAFRFLVSQTMLNLS